MSCLVRLTLLPNLTHADFTGVLECCTVTWQIADLGYVG